VAGGAVSCASAALATVIDAVSATPDRRTYFEIRLEKPAILHPLFTRFSSSTANNAAPQRRSDMTVMARRLWTSRRIVYEIM
jgi:hypothetical protein